MTTTTTKTLTGHEATDITDEQIRQYTEAVGLDYFGKECSEEELEAACVYMTEWLERNSPRYLDVVARPARHGEIPGTYHRGDLLGRGIPDEVRELTQGAWEYALDFSAEWADDTEGERGNEAR